MPLVASNTQDISTDFGDNNAETIAIVEKPGEDTYGFFTEAGGSGYDYWLFFLDAEGNVGQRFKVGEETGRYVAEYEDGLVVFRISEEENQDDPPIVYKPDGKTLNLDPSTWASLTPQYRISDFSISEGSPETEFVPISNGTSATLASGRRVEVFTASDNDESDDDNDGNDADDDGVGVFIQLYGARGNKIGEAVRVNEITFEDQDEPEITFLGGNKFLVTYADGENEPVLYKSRVFESLSSLDTAIVADGGSDTLRGDRGDNQTDIFFYDTAASESLGRDRVIDFGESDILVTTTRINDNNDDGIITFGRNRRLDLTDGEGGAVASLGIDGVRSLEFDGQVSSDGVTYYVYSRIGSDAGLDDLTF